MITLEELQNIYDEVHKYENVTLIAATKTRTKETIDEFLQMAPDFYPGENRVQELVEKYDPKYSWHLIGQLQTNKVKYIIDKVALIHSLDREDLAKEIEKQCIKHNKMQDCLIEVNMGSEISKGGVAPEEVLDFIKLMKSYPHINVKGIMSVLPNLGECDELHTMYENLHQIYLKAKEIKQENVDIKYLSCGMTNDYKIALQHGSNMIRLGRILFGERIYG